MIMVFDTLSLKTKLFDPIFNIERCLSQLSWVFLVFLVFSPLSVFSHVSPFLRVCVCISLAEAESSGDALSPDAL